MNRLRKHPLFLVAIALALPLAIALLYYDFYDDNDLVCRKQISMADNGDFLNILRKNLKLSTTADQSLPPLIMVAGANPFYSDNITPLLPSQSYSILRC